MVSRDPKQVLLTPIDLDDIPDGEYSEQKSQEEIEFEKFRDEMRDSTEYAKYTIARQPTDRRGRPIGRKLMQMFECGIDDYTFSQLVARIRDDYGTGIYKITARKSDGTYGFQQTIGIEAPASDREDNPAAGAAGELIDTFSLAMERQQTRIEALIEKVGGPRTGGDAFEQMTQMLTAMGGIMGAMGVTPQQPKSMVDQLTEWKMLKELFDGGDDGGGDANLYTLLTETVKNFGPLLGAAISAQTASGAIPTAGPIRPALTAMEPAPAPAPAAPNPSELPPEIEAMRGQINFLVSQAKLGAKAADVAAAILPGIHGDALESIEAFLQKPDCIDVCAQVNAEVNSYRTWLQDWREAMLAGLGELLIDPADEIPGDVDLGAGAGEVIGPEVLTDDAPGVQTSDHVAGLATDIPVSASADSAGIDGDTNGITGGPSRDEGDA